MPTTRRHFLTGCYAAAIVSAHPRVGEAWPRRGVLINSGWNVLPHGAGGLVCGIDIALDGSMVSRNDVTTPFIWSGTTASKTDPSAYWSPLVTLASMPVGTTRMAAPCCALDIVFAPSQSDILYAILPDTAYVYTSYLYYSTNRGASWTKTTLRINNSDANASFNGFNIKFAKQRIAVDPANPSVAYVGMTVSSGNSFGVYKTTDGATFSEVVATIDGTPSATFAVPTTQPGVAGIWFDRAYTRAHGTINVGGQEVSRRILVPIGGVGLYETLDGGQTWSEVAVTAFGGASNVTVCQGTANYDGVYYCLTRNNCWRYSGAGGTWDRLDTGANFKNGSTWLSGAANGGAAVFADPRIGHEGYLGITGPHGVGAGTATVDATISPVSSIVWTGLTGQESPILQAADYDIEWFNHRPQGLNAFLACGSAQISPDGVFWWSGNQGIWYMDSIPTYPNTTSPAIYVTTSNSMARGTDMSVASDILLPPGGVFPVQGCQDVGILQGTFTAFPANYYKSGSRMDADMLQYAASDPSIVVSQVDVENLLWGGVGSFSGYSNNYGLIGSWTAYASQPTSFYQAKVVGEITSATSLTVTSIDGSVACGTVVIGMVIYTSVDVTTGVPSPNNNGNGVGRIEAQVSGPTGGAGVYTIREGVVQPAGTTLYLMKEAYTGGIVAVDADNHICTPIGSGSFLSTVRYGFTPIYTSNRGASWNFTDLPRGDWMGRKYDFGKPAYPMACGYGSDLGTVWAALSENTNHCYIFKSTNSGANWTLISDLTPFATSAGGAILWTVPGYPQELWLSCSRTGGSQGNRIWHSIDGGVSWSFVTIPDALVYNFCLGAPQTPGGYPTLFSLGWADVSALRFIRYSIDQGSNWTLLATSSDLPETMQIKGAAVMRGDWSTFKRLFVGTGQGGFAYYNPP